MYENRTQNYDPEIYEEYLIHDTPSPLPVPYHLQPCADLCTTINTTNYLEMQQFSAVIASLKCVFLKVSLKPKENVKCERQSCSHYFYSCVQ